MGVWAVWSYDIFALMASLMGKDEVAASGVMRIMAMMMLTIPGSIVRACGIHVATTLGAG